MVAYYEVPGVQRPAHLLPQVAQVLGVGADVLLGIAQPRKVKRLATNSLAEVIEPPPLPQPVCRDADDDEVLALAIAAKVELVASGDNDLLSINSFERIPILTPAEAVGLIEATGKT